MAYCTVNGFTVVEGRLTLPRIGAWVAEMRLERDWPLTGKATIKLGGLAFVGTVQRGGAWAGSSMLRIVGGMGGMSQDVPAKAYRNATARLPVTDLLAAAGETLEPTSDEAVLGRSLPFWVMRAEPAAKALMRLLDDVPNAVWRVRPSGGVWVGVDSFPSVKLEDVQVLEQDAVNRRVVMAAQPRLLPGVTWGGSRVSYVQHQLDETQLRSHVGFEL